MLKNNAIGIVARTGEQTDPLCKKLDFLKLENINTYLIGCFMFCVFICKISRLLGFYSKQKSISSNSTRSAYNLHISFMKLYWGNTNSARVGGLLRQFSPFREHLKFLHCQNTYWVLITTFIHRCADTFQIYMWFEESNEHVCKLKLSLKEELMSEL